MSLTRLHTTVTLQCTQQLTSAPVALPHGSAVSEGPCGAVQMRQRVAEDALVPSHLKASVLIAAV